MRNCLKGRARLGAVQHAVAAVGRPQTAARLLNGKALSRHATFCWTSDLMKPTRATQFPKSLLGTWEPDNDGYSTVRFTLRAGRTRPLVSAVDTHDGERLRVSDVDWDGEALRFRIYTPSTGWSVDHEWRSIGRAKAEVRYTLTEAWTKVRDNKALQRTALTRGR